MSARAALRLATSSHHQRVDELFSQFDLANAAAYKRFLMAQGAAHLPVEEALDRDGAGTILPDWDERRRAALLRSDLAAMGAEAFEALPVPRLAGIPALLGSLYVIEGSRLGGALLRRSLPPGAPARFLAAPAAPGSWRSLLAVLENMLYEPAQIEIASAAAQAVFRLFERAGHEVLSRADLD